MRDLKTIPYKKQEILFSNGRKIGDGYNISYKSYDLTVIVSIDDGWEHVSVSLGRATYPNHETVDFIKNIFFKEDEFAMEIHFPNSYKPYKGNKCVHLWRKEGMELPPNMF